MLLTGFQLWTFDAARNAARTSLLTGHGAKHHSQVKNLPGLVSELFMLATKLDK
jgi:hypothetical protein